MLTLTRVQTVDIHLHLSFADFTTARDSIEVMSAYAVANRVDLDENDPESSLSSELNDISLTVASGSQHPAESTPGERIASDDEASVDYDPLELASIIGIIDCGSYMMRKTGRAGKSN